MTQAELMNGVLKALQLPSDYALGKAWGIPKQTLGSYRSGQRPFDAYMCTRVAEALDKRAVEILAMVELAKRPSGERKTFWENALKKRYGVASVGAYIIALSALCMLAAPSPTSASEPREAGILLLRQIRGAANRRRRRSVWGTLRAAIAAVATLTPPLALDGP